MYFIGGSLKTALHSLNVALVFLFGALVPGVDARARGCISNLLFCNFQPSPGGGNPTQGCCHPSNVAMIPVLILVSVGGLLTALYKNGDGGGGGKKSIHDAGPESESNSIHHRRYISAGDAYSPIDEEGDVFSDNTFDGTLHSMLVGGKHNHSNSALLISFGIALQLSSGVAYSLKYVVMKVLLGNGNSSSNDKIPKQEQNHNGNRIQNDESNYLGQALNEQETNDNTEEEELSIPSKTQIALIAQPTTGFLALACLPIFEHDDLTLPAFSTICLLLWLSILRFSEVPQFGETAEGFRLLFL